MARPSDYSRTLTAREIEVAELVSAGKNRGEIATQLGMARQTVTSHLCKIYTKLGYSGLGSRGKLANWVAERGKR